MSTNRTIHTDPDAYEYVEELLQRDYPDIYLRSARFVYAYVILDLTLADLDMHPPKTAHDEGCYDGHIWFMARQATMRAPSSAGNEFLYVASRDAPHSRERVVRWEGRYRVQGWFEGFRQAQSLALVLGRKSETQLMMLCYETMGKRLGLTA